MLSSSKVEEAKVYFAILTFLFRQ